MITTMQRILLFLGVVALLSVLVEIGASLIATLPGTTPARVVHVQAGPYPLKVSLYKDPAIASYDLPFAIAPEQATQAPLQFTVSSLPGKGVDATPIRGTFSADPAGGIRGVTEVTVRGLWHIHITVDGPAGHGVADIPVQAIMPLTFPGWSGWFIGFTPVLGLLLFLLIQCRNKLSIPEIKATTTL